MNLLRLGLTYFIFFEGLIHICSAQANLQNKTLILIDSISMSRVKGRIDHLAYDNQRGLVFVSAYKSNLVTVVDLNKRKVVNTIGDLRQPQGIAYIPKNNTILVANGRNGECAVFNADYGQKRLSVLLEDNADAVRYDSIENKIYVGYGNGGIAIVEAVNFKIISQIPLSSHPESFQLDKKEKKLYVNVPDAHLIEVIDLEKKAVVDKWKMTEFLSNFPMDLDEENHRLFVGCRFPPKLLVIDTKNGVNIAKLDIDNDVDDVYYDRKSKSILISCGAGTVRQFKQTNPNQYRPEGIVTTRTGARTSLLIPERNQFIVAVPSGVNSDALLMIYEIKK